MDVFDFYGTTLYPRHLMVGKFVTVIMAGRNVTGDRGADPFLEAICHYLEFLEQPSL